MKTLTSSLGAVRSTSTSQDKSKLKKSGSSTNHPKNKAETQPDNNMIYSLKQNRVKTNSHSNKKTNLSCNSNKSLKTLAESTTHLNMDNNKKFVRKADPNVVNNPSSSGTVNVKSIKQRAIGKGLNESTLQPTLKIQSKVHAEKENVGGDYMKKCKNASKELFVPMKKGIPESKSR